MRRSKACNKRGLKHMGKLQTTKIVGFLMETLNLLKVTDGIQSHFLDLADKIRKILFAIEPFLVRF